MNFQFHSFIRNWFRFMRSDRRGVLLLAGFIVLTITGQVVVDQIEVPSTYDDARFERLLACMEQDTVRISAIETPAGFDPNTATADELKALGFNHFQSSNLWKYRQHGGRFFRAEDLLKIYGVDSSFYLQVRDRIDIAPLNEERESVWSPADSGPALYPGREGGQERELPEGSTRVELNSADSLGLVSLRGIGPVFAARIIKYRALLGGFCSVSQLLEVYGFPEETFIALADKVFVDTTMIRKIRVNFADYSALIRHPYIDRDLVRALIDYRSKKGPYASQRQLHESVVIDSAKWSKLKFYLSCR